MHHPEIEHMLRTGCSLQEIERWIDHQPFGEEERAVLWLHAFIELTAGVPMSELEYA